jgi:hypothetical protein
MSDANKISAGDVAYSSAKAVLGAIPLAGSAAAELFALLITPPLEKRRQKWMDDVAEKLAALEEAGRIDLAQLRENDQFIDAVLQATSIALKTSEAEKINALQNALLNTAAGEAPDKTKSQIFLRLVDSFTVWHIKILHFFDDPRRWFAANGTVPPNVMMGGLFSILLRAFPGLQGQDDLVDVIWSDLHEAGLHRSSGLKTTMTGDGLLQERTTPLGKEFIAFISTHS